MIENGHQGRSMVSKKKEELTKKRRTQHLQQYMSKIRKDLIEQYQHNDYVQLRDLINDLFSSRIQLTEQAKQIQTCRVKIKKLWQLICFANNNKSSTGAIVAIAELLHFKVITIEMIQECWMLFGEEKDWEKSNRNDVEQGQKKEIMAIIRAPVEGDYGWLVLIRVLMTLGYCTEDMIFYCVRVLVQGKSVNQLELSLQVLHILIIQKKLVSIQDIYKLTIKNSNIKKQTDSQPHPLRTQQLIYALMDRSLDNYVAKQHSNIRYYSTKLLLLSFRSQHILSELILKQISLPRLAEYIKCKFLIITFYDKKKALQLLSQLLICLSAYNHYQPVQILSTLSETVTHIIEYTRILSSQIEVNSQLNYSSKYGYRNKQQQIDENFIFLQQVLFMMEILVEDYIFSSALTIEVVNSLLEDFMLQYVLISLYAVYSRQLKHNLIFPESKQSYDEELFEQFSQQQQNQGYTEYDLRRIVFLQKVTQLASKITSHLINLSSDIRKQYFANTTQQNVEKFLLLRNLIISRFRKSQLQIVVERQLNLSGIDLNYI